MNPIEADVNETGYRRESRAKPAGPGRAWSGVLLVSLLGSGWLLALRTLLPWVVDVLGKSSFVFILLGIPVYLVGLLSALLLLVLAPTERRRLPTVALLISVMALAVFFFAPLSHPLALLDFQRHFAARVEVVRRIETGELRWTGSPLNTLVGVPMEFPRSVSRGAGFRDVLVFREDGAVHVVFFPNLNFWPGPYVAFLYRSDGRAPSLTNRYLEPYGYTWSEPLAERWWRVVRD